MGYVGQAPPVAGVTSSDITDGAIVNADVNASAAVDYSKLAALSDGNILVGNGSNVAVSVNPSGDVDVSNAGVFSIASDSVVNADIKSDAAIVMSKTAFVDGTGLTLSTNTLNVDAAQTGITSIGTQTANLAVDNGYGVVIGTDTQETISIGDGSTDLVPELQVLGTAAADSSMLLAAFSTTATTAGSPILAFAKGGNATLGSHTVVTDGEELGNIIAFGDDGTDLETPAASIQFEVDGTPGSGDMPGRIILGTTADGATAVTEAVRIDAAQDVTFAGAIKMADDESIIFGAGSDASIEYDENGTDQLRIAGNTIFENQVQHDKDILLDSTPADGVYSGITGTFTAGETLSVGECVYLKADDTKMWKAVSGTGGTGLITAEIMCVAVAAEAITAEAAGVFLLQGFITSTAFPTYAIGETLYLPEAEQSSLNVPEGVAVDSTGDFVQVLGWASAANTIFFNPDFTIIEHA
jgi:hypothetical protein